jgi:dihydrofolate synthase/folylpolyglutamate synthase
MTYSGSIDFLHGLQLFGARFGLETTRRLAALAGNPHERLRFIHVAGTNGKGSTCAMLECIYRHAGLRVGLFSSPHLVSFAERIQVNRQLIPESEIARLVGELQPLLRQFPADAPPTMFEVTTVMALRYFAEQRCDLVIWETGLGGRLDATNIVTPLASVITNIGWDHQQWLGDTLDKIAAEKAGILKPGVSAITAAQPGRGLEVIQETARQLNVPLTHVASVDSYLMPHTSYLPLPGDHQRLTAAVAIATVRALADQIPVDEDALVRGLTGVQWPGRFQVVKLAGDRTLVLDGAHNPEGATALHAAFDQLFPGSRPTLLLGVLADKDWQAIVRILAPLAGRIVLAPVSSERTLDPFAMLAACRAGGGGVAVTVSSTVAGALQAVTGDRLVLVAGSLYLVGEVMEQLGLSPAPRADERGLNEWIRSTTSAR